MRMRPPPICSSNTKPGSRDEQAVLAAVELALEAGAPTKTHILELAAPIGRREADGCAYDRGTPGSDADHRAAVQRRALRRPAPSLREASQCVHDPASGAIIIISNARHG